MHRMTDNRNTSGTEWVTVYTLQAGPTNSHPCSRQLASVIHLASVKIENLANFGGLWYLNTHELFDVPEIQIKCDMNFNFSPRLIRAFSNIEGK